jgi:hypothetical protein
MSSKKGSIRTWDWTKLEALVLSGHSAKMICRMEEFKDLNERYLANQIAKQGWVKKREDLQRAALATLDKKIVDQSKCRRRKTSRFYFWGIG